ncbi:hypothetical protein KQ302_03270 [Synechococcus sp. CS-602]|uniref:baeRF8 domain-containing protein n=1 Tax=Synechococcaceae TaxID=1890426 RepID=UPI0008FF62D4|nr:MULTISPECIES: hypothetical protein [Synechococcaceae]MCT0245868.1 hypothetical protein [Synechococcus sp. CS-601]TWB88269.1 hypothetical protein FB106_11727 [Synechococcus sp. Ace-Pa]APD49013.1 hypothetical protein BM449_13150 [Synechococcus sp. SynAce01]MCT0204138.1 hypothetical protein [Synechococcus sp. CS-602]MCT4367994.1 hypothetical protein [Candidatus Regnicoccus frigidus MAG-AL2]
MLHVDIPTRAEIEALMLNHGPARVSLVLPTTPLTQAAQGDRIVLKNLTEQAVEQLASHDKPEVLAIEELLHDLIDDDDFWEVQANSLAVFVSPEGLRSFRLPNHLKPAVEVSDRFHVQPLLRTVTVNQSAYVLALAQNSVRLVGVSSDLPAVELNLDGMPKDVASSARKTSIKDRSPSGRLQGSEGMKVHQVQYARKIDQALRVLLVGKETPLILAAAEPMQSIYRELQSYPHLARTAIQHNPETQSDAELASNARSILDELFRDELAEIHSLYALRTSQSRTTSDLVQAARAATYGAIQLLLIDIDDVTPGTVDDDGAVTFADGPSAKSYGLVDEIASRALVTGAKVMGVRKSDIPGEAKLAAILRYPF